MNLMIMKIYTILEKNLINIITDFFKFIIFFLKKKKFKKCYFNENIFTFKYIENSLIKKCQKNNVVLFSFERIKFKHKNCYNITLKSNFFRELFFLIFNFNFFYSTTPNLNSSLFKKSISKNSKYIYLQHSPVSLLKAYNKDAFIEFDAIETINSFQYAEVNILNKKYKKKIKPFKSRYKFLKRFNNKVEKNIDVLIAPTWSTDFYKKNYHKLLIYYLNKNNISYVLRPHPMSIQKKEVNLNDLNNDNIICDLNSDFQIQNYSNLISNWSGIFIEFSLINKKKSYHINTSKKVLNENDFDDYETIEDFANKILTYNIDMNTIDIFNFNNLKANKLINDDEKFVVNKFYKDFFYNDI